MTLEVNDVTGRLIPLNEACTNMDTCEDVNAACLQGFCRCRAAYFERRGVCGTANTLLLLLLLFIIYFYFIFCFCFLPSSVKIPRVEKQS